MLADLAPGLDIPRHMSVARAEIVGVPVLILAASYSGERAFEIYAAGHQIAPVWQAVAARGADHGGCAYGLEALEILRIEKGHVVVGGEIDGRTTPRDLGLHRMLNSVAPYIGAPALQRSAPQDPQGRLQLVGLESDRPIPEGSMMVPGIPDQPQGHVTCAGQRVVGEGYVALGFLRDGGERSGEDLMAWSATRGKMARVRVVNPVFYDPEGARYRD